MTFASRWLPLGLLLLLAVIALPAQAHHWCGQTTISVSPSSPVAGKTTTFAVSVTNNGIDTTQLSGVMVNFSWEGTWKTIGSGTILAGETAVYPAGASPPSAGAYHVEVKATGTSSGDALREEADCTAVVTITATQPSPGVDAGFVGVALLMAAAAIMARRRR